ncbi:NAD(P)-binding protein [Mycena amicta]|nr:NAD(P)-binding protein [Mycena amicta]
MLQQSFFCGKPKWGSEDVPDLSSKVIIGIGKETVKVLLEHNAKVYMASRNPQKAAAAIDELQQLTSKRAVFLQLDLADLASVKKAADEFQSQETELHVLYNNGGIMVPPIEETTSAGYDLTFGTNVVGHFYLTKLLLPTLLATARTHATASRVDYATFIESPRRRRRSPFDLYAQSKWADAVMAMEVARRYGPEGIVSSSVNPGNLKTEISHNSRGTVALLKLILIYPAAWGSVAQVWAGTSDEAAGLNGKYIAPWGRVARHRRDVDDPQNGRELWEWLEEQVRKFEEGVVGGLPRQSRSTVSG